MVEGALNPERMEHSHSPKAPGSRYRKLAWVSVGATLSVITWGALVRATNSGLACPDWPTCFGQWVPPLRAQTLIEYIHRLLGSLLGVLVLGVAIFAWLKHRSNRAVFWPALLALAATGVQGWIGREVVLGDLPRNIVALHLFNALMILGLLTASATAARYPKKGRFDVTSVSALGAAAGTLLVLMIGAFVTQYHAALVFSDWPLMDGTLAPPRAGAKLLHYVHRMAAGLLGVGLGVLAYGIAKRSRHERALVHLSRGAFGLWLVQAAMGAFNVLGRLPTWSVVLHVMFGAGLWAVLVALTVTAHRKATTGATASVHVVPSKAAGQPQNRSVASYARLKAYVSLTKPRIIELLLITTVPAMILAARGWPSPWLILATLIGGSLTAGSANSINCYLDRDIDAKMERTLGRPLPRHAVEPVQALKFGIGLGIAGFAWLLLTVNLWAAALAVAAILFYVFVYTLWMKRSTPSNIVIGGAAGAAPALVGWAAVSENLSRPAWVLFAIIFYWTPPHFWALALRYSDQYRAAGVPMLPVVKGVEETTRQMLVYSWILAATSLYLLPMARLGAIYLTACVFLNAAFLAYAARLKSAPDEKRAMHLFHFSISYLVFLFSAVAVDALVRQPVPEAVYRASLAVAGVLFCVSQGVLLFSVISPLRRLQAPGLRDSGKSPHPSRV